MKNNLKTIEIKTVKIKVEQLNKFRKISEYFELKTDRKISLAIKYVKQSKHYSKYIDFVNEQQEIYNKEINEIQIRYASEDSRGNLIKDEKGNYMFKKDVMPSYNNEISELNKKWKKIEIDNSQKEFEIEPFIVNMKIDEDVNLYVLEAFCGIVLDYSVIDKFKEQLKD